jgi:hypothetical protein
MIRLVSSLLGLAVIFAVFAGTYYAPENLRVKTEEPSYQIGPGGSQQVRLIPTARDTPIQVRLEVFGGPIDVYVMPKEWADRLADNGRFNLTQPFGYEAALSRFNVTGTYEFSLVSDGQTEHLVVMSNLDDYYNSNAVPDRSGPANGTVSVQVVVHYVQDEERSLVLGYVAATPGIALVLFTLGHRIWRHRRPRKPASAVPAAEP